MLEGTRHASASNREDLEEEEEIENKRGEEGTASRYSEFSTSQDLGSNSIPPPLLSIHSWCSQIYTLYIINFLFVMLKE